MYIFTVLDCTGPFSVDVYFNSNSDANANAGNANARQSRGNKPINTSSQHNF